MNQSIKKKGGRRKEKMLERHRAKLQLDNTIKGLWNKLGEKKQKDAGWRLIRSFVMI